MRLIVNSSSLIVHRLISVALAVIFLFTVINYLLPNVYAACICAGQPGEPDYGNPAVIGKSAWCSCAQSCGDTGSVNNGPPGQGSCISSTPTTCVQGVCGACSTKNTCGNTTYDTCDTSPCNAVGATANTTFRCWASVNQASCSYSENRCGSCAVVPQQVCTPNEVVGVPECRKCNSTGTAYLGDRGGDYPLPQGSTAWCACAKGKVDAAFYKANCEKEGTKASTGGNPDDGSTCEYKILDPKTRKATYVISGQEYLLQITTRNVGKTTWKANAYKLIFSDKSKSDWDATDVILGRDIDPNETEIFDIKVKAPQTPAGEHSRGSFYAQLNSGSASFGAACEPIDIDITPPPPVVAAPAGPVSTLCYVISEDLAEVDRIKKCDFNDPMVRSYTQNPQTLNYIYKDTTPGLKNLYIKFFDNNNNPSNAGIPYTKTVLLSPIPRITAIDCKFTPNEVGTTITVNGENFATQGKGTVKVGDSQSQIVSWNNTVINATFGQRLETSARVTVTFDDGKTLSDTCLVNTTTFTFTAKNQCVKDNDFSASNVDVRIYETGAEPIIKQIIKLDKEGKPVSFAPKLEKGKKYTMIIKSPGTLAKKVEINTGTGGGTTIIDPFAVNVGDIYPRNTMDGKVNNLDVSELKRQWSPTKDTQASGDLNSDARVNNVDYSCMRININKEDETFTPSVSSNTQTIKIGNKGKVFMDTNNDNLQDATEQGLANVTVKLLKIPDTHVVGQRITPEELVNSQVLGQATTSLDGSFDLSVTRTPPVSGNFAFVVDASATTGTGGEVDWKLVSPISADSVQAWNIPVKP